MTTKKHPPITLRMACRIASKPGGRDVLARVRQGLVQGRDELRALVPKEIDPGGTPAADVIRRLQFELKAKTEGEIRTADAEIRAIDAALGTLTA